MEIFLRLLVLVQRKGEMILNCEDFFIRIKDK